MRNVYEAYLLWGRGVGASEEPRHRTGPTYKCQGEESEWSFTDIVGEGGT